jgi:hypothetical protein
MKKIILSALVCFALSTSYAQFEQGRMMVGGSLQLSTNTDKNKTGNTTVTNGKSTSFALSPQFGYFVVDNLAVGAELSLGLSKFKDEDGDSESTSSSVSIGPFVRYYFEPGLFVQGAFGIGSAGTSSTFNNTRTETKYGLTEYSLAAGYAYFLNDNIAIEPMVGFASNAYSRRDSDPKEKNIDSGLFLRVGFQIYLGK